jgi:hypothetical protein
MPFRVQARVAPPSKYEGSVDMNRPQALKRFKRDVAPSVVARYGKRDKPACREAWNDWTDSLYKNGEITQRQYNTWIGPKSCTVRKGRR